MPGVPSSRGCDACRRGKKKCDQSSPSCSRCTRLNIPCIGSGQQRFKFIDNSSKQVSHRRYPVQRNPGGEPFANFNAFLSILEITDARYDVTCYGGFVKEIPRRLGNGNEALDTAVQAMTSSFSTLYSDRNSVQALSSYVKALKALRICLDDPLKARTPDTLCAIYLVMILNSWQRKLGDNQVSHGEAMAVILRAATTRVWPGCFASQVLVTACVPVIIESIVNPRIELHPWIDNLIETYAGPEQKEAVFPSLALLTLVKYRAFIQDPENHHPEIIEGYQQIKIDASALGLHLKLLVGLDVELRVRVLYSLLITFGLILNRLLSILDQQDSSLIEELDGFITEIIDLGERTSMYRPLGASSMPLCLSIAWAVAPTQARQDEVNRALAVYQDDFGAAGWKQQASWLEERLKNVQDKVRLRDMSIT